MNLLSYSKALVPFVVTMILAMLASIGISPEMSVSDAIGMVIMTILVWAVPNNKA